MKIENEVTGKIVEVKEGYIGISLHICSFDDIIDYFAVDIEEKEIITKLNTITKIILKIEHTFEDYMKLIEDLGLEIPESYKKHWKPTLKDGTLWCYFVNSGGEIDGISFSNRTFDNELVANFNIFPNKELAERAINLSKLDRLILLWQYKNDCLFKPNFKNVDSKHSVIYVEMDNELKADTTYTVREHKTYFETKEQVKTFIEMYETEIKKIMGVI